jgi:hypothetical protein
LDPEIFLQLPNVPTLIEIPTIITMFVQPSQINSKIHNIHLEEEHSPKIIFPSPTLFKESYQMPISSKEKNEMELVWKTQKGKLKIKRYFS